MEKSVVTHQLETYTLIKNCDQSILKINPYIEKDGYQFVHVKMHELEAQFSTLFNMPELYVPTQRMNLPDNTTVSKDFYDVATTHPYGRHNIFVTGLIMLRSIDTTELQVVDNLVSPIMKPNEDLTKYWKGLERILKLYKNGDIHQSITFSIDAESRHIHTSCYSHTSFFSSNDWIIDDEDLPALEKLIQANPPASKTTKLAESLLINSYRITDNNARFVMLVTGLESIFNQSKDQLTHTIARHLALILAKEEQDFTKLYKRIKSVYGYRSKLVHGQSSSVKEAVAGLIKEVQSYLRQSILFCLESGFTKEQLFSHLNSKGVPPTTEKDVTRQN